MGRIEYAAIMLRQRGREKMEIKKPSKSQDYFGFAKE